MGEVMNFMKKFGLINTADSTRMTARNMRIFADVMKYFKPENAAEMLRKAEQMEQHAANMENAATAGQTPGGANS